MSELPVHHRTLIAKCLKQGPIAISWLTDHGPMSLVADYDTAQSRLIRAHVFYFEWLIEPGGIHGNYWWHCYPKRPGEWIAGRGGLYA